MDHSLLMPILLANAGLVMVYVLYRMIYARYTFYALNRVFLLSGILLSAILPFVQLPVFAPAAPLVLYVSSTAVTGSPKMPVAAAQSLEWVTYAGYTLLLIYVSGVLWGIVQLFRRLYALYRLQDVCITGQKYNIVYQKLPYPSAPFAFMGNIYLYPDQYTEVQLQAILEHEQLHIRGRHTLDMLCAELIRIAFWYNPWMPALKHALAQNLEYLTDQIMVGKVMDKSVYQYNLLHTATHNQYRHLTNAFLFSNLKNRITMMNRNQTRSGFKLSYLLAAPLLLAAGLSHSALQAQEQRVIIKEYKTPETPTVRREEKTIKVQQSQQKREQIKNMKKDMLMGKGSKVVVTRSEEQQALIENTKPDEITFVFKEGEDMVRLQSGDVEVQAKEFHMQNVDDGKSNTSFKVVNTGASSDDVKTEGKPLIIVDGVVKPDQQLTQINPYDIVLMNVYKNDQALIQQYGEGAKNGVIEIVTKKAKKRK